MRNIAGSKGSDSDLDGLQYHLIPMGSSKNRALQEKVYSYWKKFWGEIFAKMGHPDEPHSDEFLRQNVLAAVTCGDELVAFHLYTFFDLSWKPLRAHSYFATMTDETERFLNRRGYRHVMTMEYLSVNPEWRKSRIGVSVGDAVIALGQRFLAETHCQAAIGTARVDVKVDRSTISLGFIAGDTPVKRYDYECRWVVSPAGEHQPHPEPAVNTLVERLWRSRIDMTGVTRPHIQPLSRAA